jgi:hypothetical protein
MSEFLVRRRGETYRGRGQVLELETNLITGEKDFIRTFGGMTTLESDLLRMAAAIFATDRASPRSSNEDVCRNPSPISRHANGI